MSSRRRRHRLRPHLLTDKHPYRHKTATTHLRTFFQYLFGRGATASNLALSIPKAAKRRDARLPRHLSPDGLEAVLSSVRGNPRHGARDYAMLLLMARLGLRPPEVIAIQLDDIDWRAGESARYNFAHTCQRIGLRAHQHYCRHGRGPRIHDTFTVRTMINWYRTGKEPAREMIRLTTYLGHTSPDNTFWYLEAVPELLDLAMVRATSNGEEANL
jgi:integrase